MRWLEALCLAAVCFAEDRDNDGCCSLAGLLFSTPRSRRNICFLHKGSCRCPRISCDDLYGLLKLYEETGREPRPGTDLDVFRRMRLGARATNTMISQANVAFRSWFDIVAHYRSGADIFPGDSEFSIAFYMDDPEEFVQHSRYLGALSCTDCFTAAHQGIVLARAGGLDVDALGSSRDALAIANAEAVLIREPINMVKESAKRNREIVVEATAAAEVIRRHGDDRVLGLMKDAIANENTYKSYAGRLRALRTKSGMALASIAQIVARPDVFAKHFVAEYKTPASRRSVVSAIMAVLKYCPDLAQALPRARQAWREEFDEHEQSLEEQIGHNKLTERQKEKYVSYDRIREAFARMNRGDPHSTRKDSLRFVLLALVLDLPPTRADFGELHVASKEINRGDMNYIVVHPRSSRKEYYHANSYVVLNRFKTAKYFGRTELELSEKTADIVRASLRRWPRKYLFVDSKGNPFTKGEYSQFVRSSFEALVGRSIGISLLRHVFLSEEANLEKLSGHERARLARQMMHSTAQQSTTYRYLKDSDGEASDCECVCERRKK